MKSRLYENVRSKDIVDVVASDVVVTPTAPMTTLLSRGWMVLHEGHDNPDKPFAHEYLILVNRRSGQTIRLDLGARYPQLKPFHYIEDFDRVLTKKEPGYIFIGLDKGQSLDWLCLEDSDASFDVTQCFIHVKNEMVHYSLLQDRAAYARARQRDYCAAVTDADWAYAQECLTIARRIAAEHPGNNNK